MEKKTPRLMTPFDTLVTPPILQTLKLMLPYTSVPGQQMLGIFIKFIEFKETLAFFQRRDPALHSQTLSKPFPSSPAEILDDMAPYLPPEESSALEQFSNMMQMMEMVKMFQEAYEPADSESRSSYPQMGISPMDMMMGMLTPEQKEMFETYNSLFSNNDITNTEKSQEGDDRIE